MLKALLFDVDGTMAETEEFHRQAFNAAFEAHGLDCRWGKEEYRELLRVTGGKERMAAYFARAGRPMSDAQIAALHKSKTALYAEVLARNAKPLRAGVLRLIQDARTQGVMVALATTTTEANVIALLRPVFGATWMDHFDAIVAGDTVPRKKPAPDVYLAALAQLRIAPHEAIAIEDSAHGIASAHGAGVPVLVTPSEYLADDDLSPADILVPGLGDPQTPWAADQPGFAQRWVEIDDLRRFADAFARRAA